MKKKQKHSKRLSKVLSKIDTTKTYSIDEAIQLLKDNSHTKFDESIEVHVRTGIQPEKGDQQIRSTVSLPHGSGKKVRIVVFCEGDKVDEAKKAGADMAGDDELIDEIKKSQKTDFDIAVATPAMMKKLAVIARVLGPRGLMPSPKNDTITTNISKTIADLKKGKVQFKNDNTSNVHVMIGKMSFEKNQLKENFEAFIDALKKSKPSSAKGTYMKKVVISSSMGPGIKVSVS